MPRNMSFFLTTDQVRNQTKTVTRRNGWKFLKVGDIINACEKCQGLKKDEKVVKICQIRITKVGFEPLNSMPKSDLAKEGFPQFSLQDFFDMYTRHNKCSEDHLVNRIEFEYVDKYLEVGKTHYMDCRIGLPKLKPNSIDCVVTSPPYWCQRDYGIPNQIGLEKTPEEFVNVLADVFDSVLKALKPSGVMWLNIADTYWNGKGQSGQDYTKRKRNKKSMQPDASKIGVKGVTIPKDGKHPVIKRKELCGIPWRLALELQKRGWYLRQDVIWHKTNCMPESMKDRCTKAHEYLFLLTKSPMYYFDQYAIAKPYKPKTKTTWGTSGKGYGDDPRLIKSQRWHKQVTERKPKEWGKGKEKRANRRTVWDLEDDLFNQFLRWLEEQNHMVAPSIWGISTKGFKGQHFATFPEELVRDCIAAGCPEDGVVLDPFDGAGTTTMVAKKMNRQSIGFDLNPEYVKLNEVRKHYQLGLFM